MKRFYNYLHISLEFCEDFVIPHEGAGYMHETFHPG